MKNIRLNIDRIEGKIAVAYDENEKEYTFLSPAELSEGDIIEANLDNGGRIINFKLLAEETATEKEALQKRLSNLFNKKGAKHDNAF